MQHRIINYSHHIVNYIPVTYFTFLPPLPILATPTSLPLATTNLSSIISEVFFFSLIDSTCKWDHRVFVSLIWLISLHIMPLRSNQVAKWQDFLLFYDSIPPPPRPLPLSRGWGPSHAASAFPGNAGSSVITPCSIFAWEIPWIERLYFNGYCQFRVSFNLMRYTSELCSLELID